MERRYLLFSQQQTFHHSSAISAKCAKPRHGRTVQLQRKSRPEAAPKFIPIRIRLSSMQALTFDEVGYSSAKSQYVNLAGDILYEGMRWFCVTELTLTG